MRMIGHSHVLCREIDEPDHEQVVGLLTKGFAPLRSPAFWARALARLSERAPPCGFPRFGYALEHAGALVGVLLLIAAEVPQAGARTLRCNLSSWYVEPDFRPYGTLLVQRAFGVGSAATFLNVTPAPPTWRMLEAQGFQPYVAGRSFCLPALASAGGRSRVTLVRPGLQPIGGLSADEAVVLLDHARWECLSVVCELEGERLPFVFGPRRRGCVPFAYLIYCRDLDSFERCAGPLGRFLARRGIGFVVVDADGPVRFMPSWHQGDHPKFFRGPVRPRPGDLAYTERAVLGV